MPWSSRRVISLTVRSMSQIGSSAWGNSRPLGLLLGLDEEVVVGLQDEQCAAARPRWRTRGWRRTRCRSGTGSGRGCPSRRSAPGAPRPPRPDGRCPRTAAPCACRGPSFGPCRIVLPPVLAHTSPLRYQRGACRRRSALDRHLVLHRRRHPGRPQVGGLGEVRVAVDDLHVRIRAGRRNDRFGLAHRSSWSLTPLWCALALLRSLVMIRTDLRTRKSYRSNGGGAFRSDSTHQLRDGVLAGVIRLRGRRWRRRCRLGPRF